MMELRSGTVKAGMGLPAHAEPLAASARPLFEEGVRMLFSRWTALRLAVENEWGGPSSKDKEAWLLHESINWFYRCRNQNGGCRQSLA